MTQAQFLRLLRAATKRVEAEIHAQAQGGHYGTGLSSEGWAGGYFAALLDVEALLRHGQPSDSRRYWRDRVPDPPVG